MLSAWMIVVAVLVLYLLSSIKILREYERGLVFRLGRVLPHAKGPGIVLIFAPIDRLVICALKRWKYLPRMENTHRSVSAEISALRQDIGREFGPLSRLAGGLLDPVLLRTARREERCRAPQLGAGAVRTGDEWARSYVASHSKPR